MPRTAAARARIHLSLMSVLLIGLVWGGYAVGRMRRRPLRLLMPTARRAMRPSPAAPTAADVASKPVSVERTCGVLERSTGVGASGLAQNPGAFWPMPCGAIV